MLWHLQIILLAANWSDGGAPPLCTTVVAPPFRTTLHHISDLTLWNAKWKRSPLICVNGLIKFWHLCVYTSFSLVFHYATKCSFFFFVLISIFGIWQTRQSCSSYICFYMIGRVCTLYTRKDIVDWFNDSC